jgi:hypothetical protein
VHLLGESMGGMVALAGALAVPCLQHLVCVCAHTHLPQLRCAARTLYRA